MTDRLLAAEYVTRAPNPTSRRQNVLELTEKGKTLLGGISKAWTEVDEILSSALGENAAAFFMQAQQLRDRLGGAVPGCAKRSDK
jgi:DNA-binding MarR family transcriptional regulator